MAVLSMNELTTFRWSFEEDVAHYAAAGFSAIGVWRQKVSDYGEEKAAELLAEKGMRVSNLLWAGGFTGSDGRTHRESVHDGLEAIRQANELSADCLVVYSGARAGHTHNHARRLFREALKPLCEAAADAEVLLALEPMHPGCSSEWTFLTSLEETLELIDQFAGGKLGVVFDCYHFGFEPGAAERASALADRIGVVHLGDGKEPPDGEQRRCRLGEGRVPLAEIVAALRQAGYSGCFDVELMGEDVEAECYASLLSHSRAAFERLTM